MPEGDSSSISEYYHVTTTARLEDILKNGLCPNAKKNFSYEYSNTPTFGGVYCTPYKETVPGVIANLARGNHGLFTKVDLAVVKIKTNILPLVDEDFLFRVKVDGEMTELKYVGPVEFAKMGNKLLSKYYATFIEKRNEDTFQGLRQEVIRFMKLLQTELPGYSPECVHFLEPLGPESIVGASIFTPHFTDEAKTIFKEENIFSENGQWTKEGLGLEEVLNKAELHPTMFNQYWPYMDDNDEEDIGEEVIIDKNYNVLPQYTASMSVQKQQKAHTNLGDIEVCAEFGM